MVRDDRQDVDEASADELRSRRVGPRTADELATASEVGTPGNKFPGGHRGRVTPVPIPNTEVKPATADGTACVGVWESRSLPGLFIRKPAS